jgi:hypothetical protein
MMVYNHRPMIPGLVNVYIAIGSGLYTVNHGEYMVIIWLMMVYNHRPMIPSGKLTVYYRKWPSQNS